MAQNDQMPDLQLPWCPECITHEGWSSTKADISNAIRSGNLARLQQLKTCTVDFCETTYNGKTLLHMAVIHNQPKCLQFLLDCGIDVNICDSVQNTSLMEIVQCESRDASELRQIIKTLLNSKADINATNNLRRTALLKSIILYRHSVADILLQLGADANLGDIDGLLPLHVCATYSALPLLRRVISAGAQINGTDKKGRTALYFSVLSGHHSIVEELLKQGCDLNEGSFMGSTLQTAIVKCRLDSVRSLLMYGANVSCTIREQRSLLSKATNCLSLVLIIFHMELVGYGIQNIDVQTTIPDRLIKALQVLELIVHAYGCHVDVSKNIFFQSRQALLIQGLKESSFAQRLKRICRRMSFLHSMHDLRVLPNTMPKIGANIDKNSLENICRVKVRQLFMESKTNVMWAVEKICFNNAHVGQHMIIVYTGDNYQVLTNQVLITYKKMWPVRTRIPQGGRNSSKLVKDGHKDTRYATGSTETGVKLKLKGRRQSGIQHCKEDITLQEYVNLFDGTNVFF